MSGDASALARVTIMPLRLKQVSSAPAAVVAGQTKGSPGPPGQSGSEFGPVPFAFTRRMSQVEPSVEP
jgi:hypothetical protein